MSQPEAGAETLPGLESVAAASSMASARAAGPTRSRVKPVDRTQLTWQMLDVERLIELDHPGRAIWELSGRLKLDGFYAPIEAVEGSAGRTPWDPRLLVSLWIYAYSRGISSAREIHAAAPMNRPSSGSAGWERSITTRYRIFGW